MEEECSSRKGHQDIAATDHRDDRDHRIRIAQGIEIDPIGHREEERDEQNVPPPDKRCALLSAWIPEEEQDGQHHQALIDIEPNLYSHDIQAAHQMLVIQTAHRTGQDGEQCQIDPLVMAEDDPLFLPRRGDIRNS